MHVGAEWEVERWVMTQLVDLTPVGRGLVRADVAVLLNRRGASRGGAMALYQWDATAQQTWSALRAPGDGALVST